MALKRRPSVDEFARAGDVGRLVAALQYRDPVVDGWGRLYDLGSGLRRNAALALAAVANGDAQEVTPALVQALADPSGEVRAAAATALGIRRDTVAVPALVEVLARSDEFRYARARVAAAGALTEMASGDTLEQAARTLMSCPGEPELAFEQLGPLLERCGSTAIARASRVAADSLSDPSQNARRAASDVLVWLAPESVAVLLEMLPSGSETSRASAALTLGRIGDRRATNRLVHLLDEPAVELRRAAAAALEALADPASVRALSRAASSDPDHRVRFVALRATRRLTHEPKLTSSNDPQ